MRERIRAMIEAIVEEELAAALGASRSARVGAIRTGYRHGKRARRLTSSLGTMPGYVNRVAACRRQKILRIC